MIEEHIQDDPGITPAGQAETRERLVHQGMSVGEYIDPPMQLDRRLDGRGELPVHTPLDEIAVEAAEQLFRALAAQMEMCEIVHATQLSTFATYIVITRYSDLR